jgi:hypothetical protein
MSCKEKTMNMDERTCTSSVIDKFITIGETPHIIVPIVLENEQKREKKYHLI